MKIDRRKTRFSLAVLLLGALLATSCQNEKWEEHFNDKAKVLSNQTTWDVINANPNLKKFKWALKKTGYDKVLASSQTFTVWAPDDASADNIDTLNVKLTNEELVKQYIQNHIARFSYSASGDTEVTVTMMNNKVMLFTPKNGNYTLENVRLKEMNILTKNGIVHVVENRLPFFFNIWELIGSDQSLDSIKKFLYSYNIIIFDETKSVPGDVVDGRQHYVDSVFYRFNSMFYKIGYLNTEDSTYSMICPNNAAWIKSYDKIKDYYRYYSANPTAKIAADTLQRFNTRNSLVQDLVFSHKVNANMPPDSLQSTYDFYRIYTNILDFLRPSEKHKFYKPLDGLTATKASNGNVYITDEIKLNAWDSWHKEIRVEAEQIMGRTMTSTIISERTYAKGDAGTNFVMSNGKYISAISTSTLANPAVSFEIPNTLSGALNPDNTLQSGGAYNIYVVFAPNILSTSGAKENKVYCVLSFIGADGKLKRTTYKDGKEDFIIAKDQMTKQLVASKVVFPYSEKGLPVTSVKLDVRSSVSSQQTATYTKEMLIDCIIFEPVQE